MRSALTASLFLHLLALLLWVVLGARVPTTVLRTPRTIRVRVTTPPRRQPPAERPPEPKVETPEERREEPPPPEPEPRPEPKPKPEPAPEEKPAPAPERRRQEEPPRERPAPERQASADSLPATLDLSRGSALAATDADVPARFRYYLALLEGAVARQWHPQRIGFRGTARKVCVVHFHVEQDGRITRETVTRSSGVPLLDREALRAVRAVGRVPPLPAGMARRSLGVTFVFTLEPPGGP